MNQRLKAIAAKIDAMSLRERVMMFCAGAASIVFLLYSMMLNPLYARQTVLRAQISQQQNIIAGINTEITAAVQAYAADPDQANRVQLNAVQADSAALGASLRAMQGGLIAPERIAPLLESILKSNGRLRMVGLKTLPVTLLDGTPANAPAKPEAAKLPLLYRHGVEVAVRGNYLDMVDYMDALEAMPARLFWGKANLEVEAYPNARLTLTLYTLSLDEKWMTL